MLNGLSRRRSSGYVTGEYRCSLLLSRATTIMTGCGTSSHTSQLNSPRQSRIDTQTGTYYHPRITQVDATQNSHANGPEISLPHSASSEPQMSSTTVFLRQGHNDTEHLDHINYRVAGQVCSYIYKKHLFAMA